jgi:TfoX/Sxy family transcriptional regulator of competence genes
VQPYPDGYRGDAEVSSRLDEAEVAGRWAHRIRSPSMPVLRRSPRRRCRRRLVIGPDSTLNAAMTYDEVLADRVREAVADIAGDPTTGLRSVVERKMFGGLAFLLDGHLSVGLTGCDLMVRLDPDDVIRALARPQVRPMDFTGRVARNMVFVAAAALDDDAQLREWVAAAAAHTRTLPPKGVAQPGGVQRARARSTRQPSGRNGVRSRR